MSVKTHLAIFVLLLFAMICEVAGTELWTKNILNVGNYSYWRVGSDGSVVIVQQKPNLQNSSFNQLDKILWIARDGSVLAPVPTLFTHVRGPVYVSHDQMAIWVKDESVGKEEEDKLELFQFNASGALEKTLITGRTDTYITFALSFPYLLNATIIKNNGDGSSDYKFTLLDLTNTNTLKVVGDAVIGIQGKNLKVRWKTIANAKYKVQSSIDLINWTDYTEIIDGNGSTMVVNIPANDSTDSIFARVILL